MATVLRASLVVRALRAMILALRPVMLTGSPGCGKSDVMRQSIPEGWEFRDIRATLLDAVDLRGLPRVDKMTGMTTWASPAFLPTSGKGVLFFDELNAAAPSVQVACLQLILDRKLGEYTLPEGWVPMAAGNLLTDGAMAQRMPSALANRFVHLEMGADLDDWCQWAAANAIEPVLIAFMRFRPNLLHQHSPSEKAFPTPRSWSFVSDILKAKTSKDVEFALIRGTVGDGAATEFLAFLEVFRSLPNIDAIIMNPKTAALPNDKQPAERYAVTFALANRATTKNWKAILTYLDRLPEEYAVLGVKNATMRDATLATTQEFTDWAVKHAHILS